jgi:hypothetical protein
MNIERGSGRTVQYTNSSGAIIAVNTLVVLRTGSSNGMTGVTVNAIPISGVGPVKICGEVEVSSTTESGSTGTLAYKVNTTTNGMTTTSSTDAISLGMLSRAKTAGSTTAYVLLNGLPDPAVA